MFKFTCLRHLNFNIINPKCNFILIDSLLSTFQVWFNIEAVLSCETDLHVRRAALHLLVLLLKGVEKEFSPAYFLTDLELGTYIRDARRLLTRIEQGESDPVSKSHAQLALHELELIVQKLLSPKQELTHKIRVLL